jgi:hypothetical protein
VLDEVPFENTYTREQLQHRLLGPLRRDQRVFIGTCSRGIFLVTTPEDADATLGFYTWRVRAELRHARNLRGLAKRSKLFRGYSSALSAKKERAIIYLDESGNPNVHDLNPPVLVIGAVVIESRKELSGLEQRFKNASAMIGRSPDHELRTAGLSVAKHARVLRELAPLDYQWAAICFDKSELSSPGLADATTFYRYAFQFLVGELLTIAWQADLVIDEHSGPAFQTALEEYLRRQNSGLPVNRLGAVQFAESNKERLVQLADLVSGAVRLSAIGESIPLREIEQKLISLQYFPPDRPQSGRPR